MKNKKVKRVDYGNRPDCILSELMKIEDIINAAMDANKEYDDIEFAYNVVLNARVGLQHVLDISVRDATLHALLSH